MSKDAVFPRSVLWLACVGMVLPPSELASPALARHPPKAMDVSLLTGGLLLGQIINRHGQPRKGLVVSIRRYGHELAHMRTDGQGRFAAKGLRGGVYELATAGSSRQIRAWSENAPPAAARVALLVDDTTLASPGETTTSEAYPYETTDRYFGDGINHAGTHTDLSVTEGTNYIGTDGTNFVGPPESNYFGTDGINYGGTGVLNYAGPDRANYTGAAGLNFASPDGAQYPVDPNYSGADETNRVGPDVPNYVEPDIANYVDLDVLNYIEGEGTNDVGSDVSNYVEPESTNDVGPGVLNHIEPNSRNYHGPNESNSIVPDKAKSAVPQWNRTVIGEPPPYAQTVPPPDYGGRHRYHGHGSQWRARRDRRRVLGVEPWVWGVGIAAIAVPVAIDAASD